VAIISALIAMILLARENGWAAGDDLFKYIKFAKKIILLY